MNKATYIICSIKERFASPSCQCADNLHCVSIKPSRSSYSIKSRVSTWCAYFALFRRYSFVLWFKDTRSPNFRDHIYIFHIIWPFDQNENKHLTWVMANNTTACNKSLQGRFARVTDKIYLFIINPKKKHLFPPSHASNKRCSTMAPIKRTVSQHVLRISRGLGQSRPHHLSPSVDNTIYSA